MAVIDAPHPAIAPELRVCYDEARKIIARIRSSPVLSARSDRLYAALNAALDAGDYERASRLLDLDIEDPNWQDAWLA